MKAEKITLILNHLRSIRKRGDNMNINADDLDEMLGGFFIGLEEANDESLAEILVVLHRSANDLLIEAQRRGILDKVMKKAMTLDGAPNQN